MSVKITFAIAACLLASTPAFSQPQAPRGAVDVTVPAVPGVVASGAKWRTVWSGLDNADGIVGTADGGVIFAQREVNRVRKVDLDGKTSVLVENTDGAGALGIDYQGRIVAMLRTHPSVALLTPERKLLTDNYQGIPLKGASDLVVEKKGGLYFTESRRMPTPGSYYLGPDGKMFFFGDGRRANGLALSPDEKTLYLPNRETIEAFDILPDGTGTNRRDFAKLQGEGIASDGMAVDAAGRLYATTRIGIQIISPKGENLGTIPTPRLTTSVAFSGPGKKMLFVIGRGALDSNGAESNVMTAKTIYALPMLAEGFKGRAK
jgi:gluconolactonase